jgi:hypothetical protein
MNRYLLYGAKACICVGSAALSVGLAAQFTPSDTSNSNSSCSSNETSFGSLADILSPPLKQLHRLSEFYPHVRTTYKAIVRRLQRFSACFHDQTDRLKASRELVRIQRRLFDALDAFVLHLSESTALEDVSRATDDLKQTVTDLVLGVDI